jgi:hypothetical protein
MFLSVLGSIALVLIGLFATFLGWLAVMRYRVEPETTTQAAARGGWVWIIGGLGLAIWGIVRLFL